MCFPLEGFWQRKINEGIGGNGKTRVTEGFRCSAKKKRCDAMIICTC